MLPFPTNMFKVAENYTTLKIIKFLKGKIHARILLALDSYSKMLKCLMKNKSLH